jgi:DNA-binding NarL/FixJ family response regulator
MEKVRVFIVDDHAIFRDGLKLLFSTIKNVEIVGEATNGKTFLDNLAYPLPDIVFMDINMREMDGIETTQNALKKFPDLKIVALTSFEDEEYFNKMTDLGVRGYLLKNSAKEDFEKAIHRIIDGYYYYSDELVVKLARKMAQIDKLRRQPVNKITFSDEEKSLLKHICLGFTNKQIADLMHLSARTIEAHRAKLLDKTNTKNSVALAVFAIANKIVDPGSNKND